MATNEQIAAQAQLTADQAQQAKDQAVVTADAAVVAADQANLTTANTDAGITNVSVHAIAAGFYGGVYRNPGDAFVLGNLADFDPTWMSNP